MGQKKSVKGSTRNEGVDAAQAAMIAQHERDGTTIGVHIHFGVGVYEGHPDENTVVKKAWQDKDYGFATIKALAVNYGKGLEAGTITPGKPCGKCGDYTPGDIDSLETLKQLVEESVQYALTRPITKEEAGKAVSFASAELEKQSGMNDRLDFSELTERLNTLKAKNISLAFSHDATVDFRAVQEEADAIVKAIHTAVVLNLANSCRELAGSLNTETEKMVEVEIEKATKLPELYHTIGALAACRKTLRQNGAKYASQVEAARRAETERDAVRQFQPTTKRGKRGNGGGRFAPRGVHY